MDKRLGLSADRERTLGFISGGCACVPMEEEMIQSDLSASVIIIALLLRLELDLEGGTYEGLKCMHSCTMSQLWVVHVYEIQRLEASGPQ